MIFPNTIATGTAFCNRTEEKKLIKQYINNGVHTVVIAPRRYGKTSLINQALLESKLPHTIMELTMVTSKTDLEAVITKKVGELLYTLLPKANKLKQQLLNLFNFLHPEIILSAAGQKVVLHPEYAKQNDIIAETLKSLNEAAKEMNKRVVIVMDEFQEIENIKESRLEASIRHAMQYSTHVSYIFSGSKRHMLMNMFHDKNRPFYNACELVTIERIHRKDYELFIQQAANDKWHKPLPSHVMDLIFTKSERYPAYINRICGYFWHTDQFPSTESIESYWHDYVISRHSAFTRDIFELSQNQRTVLKHLALSPCQQPFSQDMSHKVGLSTASTRQAFKKLEELDYIYCDDSGYHRLLDPAFRDYILKLEQ